MNAPKQSLSYVIGVPWTLEKMEQAVAGLREDGSVLFTFGHDDVADLPLLNDWIFARRPDVRLQIGNASSRGAVSSDELKAVVEMGHVRRLEVTDLGKKAPFDLLAGMRDLTSINMRGHFKSLAFLSELKALTSVWLCGASGDVQALAHCTQLQTLILQWQTLSSLEWLEPLKQLDNLMMDVSRIDGDFSVLQGMPSLRTLSLAENHKLTDVDFLGALTQLHTLVIRQKLVETLPDFSRLAGLRKLELKGMRAWRNPEVLATVAHLASLTIWEINPKLAAERFFFLAELPELTRLDFCFIDFSKRRRVELFNYFAQHAKPGLVVDQLKEPL